jgi:hypothetical protein
VRQALARLLTLYMEFGSDIAAKGGRLTTKDKTTLAQVRQLSCHMFDWVLTVLLWKACRPG